MSEANQESRDPMDPEDKGVWSYRGYRLRPGDFTTAMVHFYRGEIARSNTWRTRLDTTTNWAVVTTAGVVTFTFGTPDHSHAAILIGFLLLWIFLVIESRRYRYYELWALRVRLMETDFFAQMLAPPFTPHEEWAARLVDSLTSPRFPISRWEAMGRRLRRNFLWLYLVLLFAWLVKLLIHPSPAGSAADFFAHAQLGAVPGRLVVWVVIALFGSILLLSFLTAGLRASPGEVLSQSEVLGVPGELLHGIARAAGKLPFVRRHERLALIITEKPKEVSEQLLKILKRGVTGVQGVGMYSGTPRSILFCAITPSEAQRLRQTVHAVDEQAFLVVNPTEEVRGGGFRDLKPDWRAAGKAGPRSD